MFRPLLLALALLFTTASRAAEDPVLAVPDIPPSPPVSAPAPPAEVPEPPPAPSVDHTLEAPPEVKTAPEHPEDEFRAVRIAAGAFNFDYAEELPKPLKSTEQHVIPAVNATFIRSTADWFLRGSLDFGVGKTKYDGTDQTGTPLITETQNTFVNAELDVGLVLYHLPNESAIAAYVGLGTHYWRRELISYLELYSWMYLPIGVNYAWSLDREWRVGLDLALKVPFYGLITANFSDFDPSLVDGRGILGTERTGVRVQLPVSYLPEVDGHYSILVTPWFEYSGLSNGPDFPVQNILHQQITLAHEPPSRSYRYGVWIGAEIRL